MRYIIRDGGSNASRRGGSTRIVALAATFLLLGAGVVVSAPGLTASATGSIQVGDGVEDHGDECVHHEGQGEVDNSVDETSTTVEDACEVTTLTVVKDPINKHGGTLMPEDFQLLVDGVPQAQNVATTVTPDVSHEVSEKDQPGYELRGVICLDDDTNEQVSGGETVALAPGQHVTCTVINDDIAPTLIVQKEVVTDNGGMAKPEDFQMTLDGAPIAQDKVHHIMANEPAVVSEDDSIPGYAPTSAVCESDIAESPNNKTVTDKGAIEILPMLGENIYCVITNDDVAPGLTVVKKLDNGDGGNEAVSDFALQVNGDPVVSGELTEYDAEVDLSISETQLPGWVASNVRCESSDIESVNNINDSDDLDPAALATVSLQAGESVVCTITNDDIAPTVTVHKVVTGGNKPASEFQMTLDGSSVDQDSPSPKRANTPIEVSEIADPGYEQSGDVVCTDADTDETLAGQLVLDEGQNAICTITNVVKAATPTQASITIDKVDDVEGAVHPGGTYSYFLKVSNDGPSTLLANLTLTDDLPSGLVLVSVDAPAPWNCNTVDPLVCTYESALQPGATTEMITIVVELDSGFVGEVVVNQATTTAIVDPPTGEYEGGNPGTSVTATDDETTPVVRSADVSIVKTTQNAAAVVGQPFDWTLVVTNNGPDTATAVHVADAMPSAFKVVAAFTSVGSCVTTAQTVQCDLGNLADGASATITVQSMAVTASVAPVTNTATASSSSADPDLANNTSSAAAPIAPVSRNASEAPVAAAPGFSAPPAQLPRTGGSSPVGLLTLASLLVGGGFFSLVIGRRRRSSTAQ